MAQIDVGNETKQDGGWSFQVQVRDGGRTHQYAVTLSKDDYDRWAGDKANPARVVEAAFEFLLDNEPPSAIMSRFDCSVIRSYFPHVDKALPARL
jgi:hypothetical protein